ncbi:hypothetical protein Tco_1159447, partial [Tanacetum coccineum]
KTVEEEKVEEEDVKPNPVLIEKKAVKIRRKTLARRRASNKQSEGSSKRQKKKEELADYEEVKEELRMWLTVVLDEEEFVDHKILHTRFPIVDCESQSLYSMHVYKIIRADGNTSYHKTFESMLKSLRFYTEKQYPLTKETLQKMLNWKLEAEAESSMAFELLKYPDGVKGYRLWRLDDVKLKIIIRRDVVFNESLLYKDTLKGAGAADSRKEVKFEVELQGSRVKPIVDPHTWENPGNKDEEQNNEEPQQHNRDNYVLVRDTVKKITIIPERYRDE